MALKQTIELHSITDNREFKGDTDHQQKISDSSYDQFTKLKKEPVENTEKFVFAPDECTTQETKLDKTQPHGRSIQNTSNKGSCCTVPPDCVRIKIIPEDKHLYFDANNRPDVGKILASTNDDRVPVECADNTATERCAPTQPEMNQNAAAHSSLDDVSVIWEDWEDETLQPQSPHTFYIPYRRYLVKILTPTARKFLSDRLNGHVEGLSRTGLERFWMGFVHCIGKDMNYVFKMERCKDPFAEVLLDWQTESGSTIGKLLHFLEKMDRYDVIDDTSFMDIIHRSVKTYDQQRDEIIRQKEEARHHNETLEAQGFREEETYDAFICYDEEDREFIKELIYELETKENLRVCTDASALLEPGQASITAEEIKARCKRLIAVLSETFIYEGNEMYNFAVRVAQCLSPVTSKSKVIPIAIDKSVMPHEFSHITPVDFVKCRQRLWLWRKISGTLKNPPDPFGQMERQKLRHVHLIPKEQAIDIRAQMQQEDYKPSGNLEPKPLRLPKKEEAMTEPSTGVSLKISERSVLRQTLRQPVEEAVTAKQKIKRTWFNGFFRRKKESDGTV